jgi:hypothetical protein
MQLDEETKNLLTDLVAEIFYLRDQLVQSGLNETALILSLKELVPEFGPRFDQWRMKSETLLQHPDETTLEALRKAQKLLIQ